MRDKVGEWSLFSDETHRSWCQYVSFNKKSSMEVFFPIKNLKTYIRFHLDFLIWFVFVLFSWWCFWDFVGDLWCFQGVLK